MEYTSAGDQGLHTVLNLNFTTTTDGDGSCDDDDDDDDNVPNAKLGEIGNWTIILCTYSACGPALFSNISRLKRLGKFLASENVNIQKKTLSNKTIETRKIKNKRREEM